MLYVSDIPKKASRLGLRSMSIFSYSGSCHRGIHRCVLMRQTFWHPFCPYFIVIASCWKKMQTSDNLRRPFTGQCQIIEPYSASVMILTEYDQFDEYHENKKHFNILPLTYHTEITKMVLPNVTPIQSLTERFKHMWFHQNMSLWSLRQSLSFRRNDKPTKVCLYCTYLGRWVYLILTEIL